ncbi:MAG TPA: TIGR03667 family PPOX class F420-dependent oxidoreductase [Anaerolineales bacterium]|jgi:PPOX class probable F420-dependent enzyme
MDFNTDLGRKARRFLENSYVIWLTTVDASFTPQPRPVWFVWHQGSFLIYSKPQAHKLRHIRERPRVSLHFNTDQTGDIDVVVFLGDAAIDPVMAPAHTMSAYLEKYRSGIEGLEMSPEEFSQTYSTAIRVRPSSVRGW